MVRFAAAIVALGFRRPCSVHRGVPMRPLGMAPMTSEPSVPVGSDRVDLRIEHRALPVGGSSPFLLRAMRASRSAHRVPGFTRGMRVPGVDVGAGGEPAADRVWRSGSAP